MFFLRSRCRSATFLFVLQADHVDQQRVLDAVQPLAKVLGDQVFDEFAHGILGAQVSADQVSDCTADTRQLTSDSFSYTANRTLGLIVRADVHALDVRALHRMRLQCR